MAHCLLLRGGGGRTESTNKRRFTIRVLGEQSVAQLRLSEQPPGGELGVAGRLFLGLVAQIIRKLETMHD